MSHQYTYLILGAGRQGTAAAYDLAFRGDARRVILADQNLHAARDAVARIGKGLKEVVLEAVKVDVNDLSTCQGLFQEADVCLSAVPYQYNLKITELAVDTHSHLCDLGGNTDIARQQHEYHKRAKEANLSIIPNCGQVPGLGTSLVVYAMEILDEPVDIYMWDGGIPFDPRPPFNYLLTFHIGGLTNEYAEPAVFIRDGAITQVEPMTELETVEFPEPIGPLEAFVTGGGTDTMPWSFEGKLRTLQNLTLRYPGHFSQLRAYYDLGLWDLDPLRVNDVDLIPRDIFHALFEPKVTFKGDKDIVIVRVKALGKKSDRHAEVVVELVDYYDTETGFTAMERSTGWSAAIVAGMMARGETRRGAGGVELMVPATRFVQELLARGLEVTENLSFID